MVGVSSVNTKLGSMTQGSCVILTLRQGNARKCIVGGVAKGFIHSFVCWCRFGFGTTQFYLILCGGYHNRIAPVFPTLVISNTYMPLKYYVART
ncbi:hypothetical protein F4819DRAFT_156004 [Hypoxylon fuscum]|nr:hypothetical protein F4819DRAFT_156004 [Hypoxylon fuscum]